MLVNTVYLDATWATPFEPNDTKPHEFTTSDARTVSTGFMDQGGFHRYLDRPDSQVVELAYADGDLSMWLIVPKETQGLAEVEAALDAATVADFSELAVDTDLGLKVPRWDVALPSTDLVGTWLCPRGLCPEAEFFGIDDQSRLESALHSARIVVSEEGTEAAAATTVTFARVSATLYEVDVTADHPFAYVIVHEPTDSILFVGRVTDPTAH